MASDSSFLRPTMLRVTNDCVNVVLADLNGLTHTEG